MRNPLPCGLVLLLAAWASGCQLLPASQIACSSDLDCPTGNVCNLETQLCLAPAGNDAGPSVDAGPSIDAGADAGPTIDAGTDAGVDAGTDAGVDAGPVDAGFDAGPTPDAGQDAGPSVDAGEDAGPDAGPALDAGEDAGPTIDAGTDAGMDAGVIDAGETPTTITISSGDGQSAAAGTALLNPLVVLVTDSAGHPVSGVAVTWTATMGNGTWSPAAPLPTDSNGYAEVNATLGDVAGDYAFSAAIEGSLVIFSATAVAGQAASMTAVSGNGQTAVVGLSLPSPLEVFVADAHGNPVNGYSVAWTVGAGGLSITAASMTDDTGVAVATAALGTVSGSATFTAVGAGLAGSPVTFTATATPGPAAALVLVSGNNQIGAISGEVLLPLVVKATDANSNPVAGVSVAWAPFTAGKGTITAGASSTNAIGLSTATIKLDGLNGVEKFTATAGTLTGSPVTFSETAVTPSPTKSTITATPSSTWADGLASATITVTSENASGLLISGLPVMLQLSGSATADPLAGVTNAAGVFVSHLTSTHPGGVGVSLSGTSSLSSTLVNFDNPACSLNGFSSFSGGALSVGNRPTAVVSGDFNGDGEADLAAANTQDGTVSVLLGNGSGGFTSAGNPVTVGSSPVALATGDFNADGVLDLAVANSGDGTVSLLLGNGSGGFTSTTPLQSGNGPSSLAVADFNRDGNLDLVVANKTDGSVTVMLGTGTGGFTVNAAMGLGNSPYSIATGDFNADGIPDLAIADNVDVVVLEGSGTGAFTAFSGSPLSAGAEPESVTVGDFNGDGIPDLAVGAFQDSTINLLLGAGSGTFEAAQVVGAGDVSNPAALAAGDFNGDNVLDLAVANYGGNGVTVLLGEGGGSTSVYFYTAAGSPYAVGSSQTSVALGDFTGGGKLDLATANSLSDTLSVLQNGCVGSAAAITLVSGNDQTAAVGSMLAPFTVLITDSGQTPVPGVSVYWYPQNLTGVVYQQPSIPQTSVTGADGTATAIGTLGSIVGTQTFTGSIQALTSVVTFTATATVGPPNTSYSLIQVSGESSSSFEEDGLTTALVTVTLADQYDNVIPGEPILLHTTGAANLLDPLSGKTGATGAWTASLTSIQDAEVTVSASAGGFTLNPVVVGFHNVTCSGSVFSTGTGTTQVPIPVGMSPQAIVAGNFNGDGLLDLAVVNAEASTLSVLIGGGAGTFTALPTGALSVDGTDPLSVATGDFNGDGALDLAIASSGGNVVVVLLGNGTGGFAASSASPATVGMAPRSVTTGDFNGDGLLDLAVANSGDDTVSVLLGNGSGGFTSAESPVTVGTTPYALAVADFNSDGRMDLAVTNEGSNNITFLLGDGAGGMAPAIWSPVTVGKSPQALVVGYFNADTYPDLAVVYSGADSVSLLLGQGGGVFSPSLIGVGSSPVAIVTGDINGDGNLDLVIANKGDNTVSVLAGNGMGSFTSISGSPFTVGSAPSAIALGAFNGAGYVDMAVTNSGAGTVSIVMNACDP